MAKQGEGSKPTFYEKDIMLKDAVTLSNKITLFCRAPRMVTYVRFKLQQFQATFSGDLERYAKANDALIERISPNEEIVKYLKDGRLNPKWTEWRNEITKVEEEKVHVKFEKLPLSMVVRLEAPGMPDELFYEDPAVKAIVDKMMEKSAEVNSAE